MNTAFRITLGSHAAPRLGERPHADASAETPYAIRIFTSSRVSARVSVFVQECVAGNLKTVRATRPVLSHDCKCPILWCFYTCLTENGLTRFSSAPSRLHRRSPLWPRSASTRWNSGIGPRTDPLRRGGKCGRRRVRDFSENNHERAPQCNLNVGRRADGLTRAEQAEIRLKKRVTDLEIERDVLKKWRLLDCYDNAMCESFNATLECELLVKQRFKNQREAALTDFDFVEG
jgi:hypothetical protein